MVRIDRNDGFVFNAETERLESYKFISASFNFAKQTFEILGEDTIKKALGIFE
jgi:hypothetical protein